MKVVIDIPDKEATFAMKVLESLFFVKKQGQCQHRRQACGKI